MARRSCDFCVQRKTKCDNGRPCRKCVEAKPPLECTYLKPVLKRGPKTSKLTQRSHWRCTPQGDILRSPVAPSAAADPQTGAANDGIGQVFDHPRPRRLSLAVFEPIIEAYRSRMYPVWPVVNATDLLERLKDLEKQDDPDLDVYIMATALCAATMAQLNLTSMDHVSCPVDSTYMERECTRTRCLANYREFPSINSVLTSFFLHVYHAKADNRNSAMLFLHEGISLARLLHLDQIELDQPVYDSMDKLDGQTPTMSHERLLYLLLWVSERGYGILHDLPISIQGGIRIPSTNFDGFDIYGKGLIELASLFSVFDSSFYRSSQCSPEMSYMYSEKQRLIAVHRSLEKKTPRSADYDLVQKADYNITKNWMRVLVWQQAMSRGLLSSTSEVESMTFLFPSRIAQDLLTSITDNSKDHLLALGRDQLFKSFEITNTLADVILCTATAYNSPYFQASAHCQFVSDPGLKPYLTECRDCWRCGPADFLHDLFLTVSPFLTYDKKLSDMLRMKVSGALFRAPNRVIPRSIEEPILDGGEGGNNVDTGYIEANEENLVDDLDVLD